MKVYPGTIIDSRTGQQVMTDADPDLWVCRRVEDFKELPKGAGLAACSVCEAEVVYNAEMEFTSPKACIQCVTKMIEGELVGVPA